MTEEFVGYHGTNSKLDRTKINVGRGGDYGPGLYLASDIADTKIFGTNVYEAKFLPKKMLDASSPEGESIARKLTKAIGADEYIEQSSGLLWADVMGLVGTSVEIGEVSWQSIVKWLTKQGFDCVIIPNAALKKNRGSAKGDLFLLDPRSIDYLLVGASRKEE